MELTAPCFENDSRGFSGLEPLPLRGFGWFREAARVSGLEGGTVKEQHQEVRRWLRGRLPEAGLRRAGAEASGRVGRRRVMALSRKEPSHGNGAITRYLQRGARKRRRRASVGE